MGICQKKKKKKKSRAKKMIRKGQKIKEKNILDRANVPKLVFFFFFFCKVGGGTWPTPALPFLRFYLFCFNNEVLPHLDKIQR
jgi:hypothetical protein